MNDFFEHLGSDLKEIGEKAKAALGNLTGKKNQTVTTPTGSVITAATKINYEINLVPEVKAQMIRAQKVRNLVLFLCIVVSGVAVGVVVLLFGVKSGQDIVISSQDKKLATMSDKLNSYSELNSLITIQGQLEGIEDIIEQKTVLSRVFGALAVMLPTGGDSVQLSELNVNLENNAIRMEGQADARVDPLIDYRVLESFKKGVALTKYDYGRYVDADGEEIPTHCIRESNDEGIAYKTGDSYYAWWDLTIEGCEASQRGGTQVADAKYYYSSTAEVEKGVPSKDLFLKEICNEDGEECVEQLCDEKGENCADPAEVLKESEEEAGEGEGSENSSDGQNNNGNNDTQRKKDKLEIVPVRVKIWRTPQFAKWYQAGRMSLDGDISGIEHFVSKCINYKGTLVGKDARWTSTNECMLAPDGFEVTESSNGRDESNNLVLKFAGTTTLAEGFFSFNNKHMIAIGPMGQNVTDSYVQIGEMFAQEATDCPPDDSECLNNTGNRGDSGNNGGNNSNGSSNNSGSNGGNSNGGDQGGSN